MTNQEILSIDDKLDILNVQEAFAVDTEGINRWLGVSVAGDGPWGGMYFPIDHDQATGNLTTSQQLKLFNIIRDAEYIVMHHAAHDLRFMQKFGLSYRGWFYDTMLMAHWINEEMFDYSLDSVSKFYGGKPKNLSEQMKNFIEIEGWDKIPISWMEEYSANDAYITWDLYKTLKPIFEHEGFDGELWNVEQKFVRDVMIPMMNRGITLDLDFASNKYVYGVRRMEELKKELGFNPASSKDLQRVLIQELGLPVVKHTASCSQCKRRQPVNSHTWNPSFDKTAMEEYEVLLGVVDDERATKILEFKGWQKTTSSNYKPYLELAQNSILHPGYKLHGTKTGRLSCEKPNLQQIPKSSNKPWNGDLKNAFVAREGFRLWTVDFSQLQFRMTVGYAKQQELIDIFNDPTRDIFSEIAAEQSMTRDKTKTLVYMILFGGGGNRAATVFKVSLERGKSIINSFFSSYPKIRRIAADAEAAAKAQGYVTYWTGRRRHFPRGRGAHKAFNAVIQGGEAEIIKRCMIKLQEEVCDENCFMVLQIHDEVVFEIKEGLEQTYLRKAQKVMESVPKDFCDFIGVDIAFKTDAKPWGAK